MWCLVFFFITNSIVGLARSPSFFGKDAYLTNEYINAITAYGPGLGVFTPYSYVDISYDNIPFVGKIPVLGKEGTSSKLGISPFYPPQGNPSNPFPPLYRARPLPLHVPEPQDVVAVPLDEEALHGEPLFPPELVLPFEQKEDTGEDLNTKPTDPFSSSADEAVEWPTQRTGVPQDEKERQDNTGSIQSELVQWPTQRTGLPRNEKGRQGNKDLIPSDLVQWPVQRISLPRNEKGRQDSTGSIQSELVPWPMQRTSLSQSEKGRQDNTGLIQSELVQWPMQRTSLSQSEKGRQDNTGSIQSELVQWPMQRTSSTQNEKGRQNKMDSIQNELVQWPMHKTSMTKNGKGRQDNADSIQNELVQWPMQMNSLPQNGKGQQDATGLVLTERVEWPIERISMPQDKNGREDNTDGLGDIIMDEVLEKSLMEHEVAAMKPSTIGRPKNPFRTKRIKKDLLTFYDF
ncbi:hypothetical protein KIN20_007303 [Parelaphostrongylus tenuis]|uniref:Uncharacterized protein n=1 Tax=Parelaphostrongylus tenuis TaxID=148309 RepID=A0AAD5M363_PARTN|nr:hypothetical protein KIN20_007303 [Parelaphostrongylus tenuis]